jgi:hypothetical protein
MTPHPELRKLYAARAAMHEARGDVAHPRHMADLEHRIHVAERKHGRGVFTFRRCAICRLLHEAPDRAAVVTCDGRGLWMYQAWLRYGADLVHIIE